LSLVGSCRTMRVLLVAAIGGLLLGGCGVAEVVDALKHQSVKDAEEKKEIIDGCIEPSRVLYSEREAKELCDCGYKRYKFGGMSMFDAGLQCGKEVLSKRRNK